MQICLITDMIPLPPSAVQKIMKTSVQAGCGVGGGEDWHCKSPPAQPSIQKTKQKKKAQSKTNPDIQYYDKNLPFLIIASMSQCYSNQRPLSLYVLILAQSRKQAKHPDLAACINTTNVKAYEAGNELPSASGWAMHWLTMSDL